MKAIKDRATGEILDTNPPESLAEHAKTSDVWELVEVLIIEAKPVTETIIWFEVQKLISKYQIVYGSDAMELLSLQDMKRGFRAACEYLGVPITEEGK